VREWTPITYRANYVVTMQVSQLLLVDAQLIYNPYEFSDIAGNVWEWCAELVCWRLL